MRFFRACMWLWLYGMIRVIVGLNGVDSSEEQWRSLSNSPKRACLA